MTWWMSVILGFIQGVSEFLPISSSGHLALFQNLLGVETNNTLLFDLLLHVGTLAAVCVAYREDITGMFLGFFSLFTAKGRADQSRETFSARRMLLLILLATLPLVTVVFFKDYVEGLMSNTIFVGCALLATGALLFISDRLPRGSKDEGSARVTDVLFVGAMQVLATIPGLSRSGTTISAGLMRGFDRRFAVRFSFLMSLPAIVGATLLEVADVLRESAVEASELLIYLPGVVVAGIAGYFSIVFVRKLAQSNRFGGFAYYCWGVGLLAIVLTLVLK